MKRDMRATTHRPTRRATVALGAASALALAFPAARAWATPEEIPYGEDRRQRLDVYARPGLSGAPMLMFVHGGGWSFGDKSGVNALPGFAERHGWLLSSAGYRLAPQVDAGGCAEDVAAAVAWMMQHAAAFGGDPKRFYLMGHSAGAQIVALVGVDPRYLGAHGLKPSDLAGVIALDGAGYDAAAELDELKGHPLLRKMYERGFGPRAADLSATRLVKPGLSYPPFLILYTDRDSARRRSDELAGRLRATGGRAADYLAPGKTHMQINRDLGVEGDPEGARVATFIEGGAP
jgi:acetyl esterase/lipase